MMANIHSEIDLNKGIPSLESFKENLESFIVEIHLEPDEFICLFKEYIRSNLDLDLDELNVLTILDFKSRRIVLDTEYLEENDINELIYLIDEFKYHFGRSIFDIRTAVNASIALRKILSNCSSYRWNNDGSIDICYSLLDITQNEIGQYLNLNE